MKIKTIITSLIILIIIIGIFTGFYLYTKQKDMSSINNAISTDTQKQNTDRKNFNTNTSINTAISTTTDINQNNTKTNIIEDYTNTEGQKGLEDNINQNIKKNLVNWNITRDPQLINQSVILSNDTDNEAVLDAWKDFMSKNSSELIKIVNTNSNTIKTKDTVRLIFEWYINLSGEYDKLSSTKKQEISNQYKQLK